MEYVNQKSDKISGKVKRRKSNAPVFSYWYENSEPNKSKITLCVKQKINNMRNGVTHVGFMLRQKDTFNFSLSFNLWRKSDFVTLVEWFVKKRKELETFIVWKLSSNRKSWLEGQLLVCDVANLAIKEWNKNYSKGAEELGFNKHG